MVTAWHFLCFNACLMEPSILMEIEMELTYVFYFVLLLSLLVGIAGRPKKGKKRVPESVSESEHFLRDDCSLPN